MFRKSKLVHFALLGTLLFSAYAIAGVAGGNTSLFDLKNDKGEPIKITFSTEHPEHQKILSKLNHTKLPPRLKREILADLVTVAIRYSNEMIKNSSAERQLQLVLKKVTRKTIKNGDGSVEKVVEKEEFESDPRPEVHIHPVNIVSKNKDAYVAAFTQVEPKTVTYFTPFLDKMSQEDKIKLVLHEQAHRLEYLKKYRNDERFVEGWATSLTSYLLGDTNEQDFYQLLNANKLSTTPDTSFADEKYYTSGTPRFEALIQFSFTEQDILFKGIRTLKRMDSDKKDSHFILQLDADVFKDYPQMKDLGAINLSLAPMANNEQYTVIRKWLDHHLEDNYTISMQALLNYKKEVLEDNSSNYYNRLTLLTPADFSAQRQSEVLETQVKQILSRHPVSFGRTWVDKRKGLRKSTVYLKPHAKAEVLNFVRKLDQFFDTLRMEKPDLYHRLEKLYIQWDISWINKTGTFTYNAETKNYQLKLGTDQDSLSQIDETTFERAFKRELLQAELSAKMKNHRFIKKVTISRDDPYTAKSVNKYPWRYRHAISNLNDVLNFYKKEHPGRYQVLAHKYKEVFFRYFIEENEKRHPRIYIGTGLEGPTSTYTDLFEMLWVSKEELYEFFNQRRRAQVKKLYRTAMVQVENSKYMDGKTEFRFLNYLLKNRRIRRKLTCISRNFRENGFGVLKLETHSVRGSNPNWEFKRYKGGITIELTIPEQRYFKQSMNFLRNHILTVNSFEPGSESAGDRGDVIGKSEWIKGKLKIKEKTHVKRVAFDAITKAFKACR